ncbi:MAG TPA: D-alanyl-D-alanine carboxypeptidase family protein [Dehalococcoidia bacterium]|nr:D-alanyl-D-alanine carboxypeptidase family protein [Dehalococcoidia bacterium]
MTRRSWVRPRLGVILLFAALSTGFGPPSFTEGDGASFRWTRESWRALSRQLPPPNVGEAALLMDGETGLVLFERNANARRAPASLTKIMTALVALEQGRQQDQVHITLEDMVEGSSMGLAPGDVLSLESLLYGLLLPSGNDAALAIARHVGGTVESFVAMMNARAQRLGLRDIHFVNPHGLDEDQHYSSAYDMAVLTREALRDPVFARIVGTTIITVTGNRPFLLSNSNLLLHQPGLLQGIDGVKTGHTENAGDSLVVSVTRQGHRLIGVVLGAQNRQDAGYRLMAYGLAAYQWRPLPELPSYILRYRGSAWSYQTSNGSFALGSLLPSWGAARVALRVQWEEERGGGAPLGGRILYTWGDRLFLEQPFRLGP